MLGHRVVRALFAIHTLFDYFDGPYLPPYRNGLPNMKRFSMSIVAVLLLGWSSARADYIIDVENVTLLADTPDQIVRLFIRSDDVANDEDFAGFDLAVELGDGVGPLNEPIFTELRYSNGFLGNIGVGANGGPNPSFPQIVQDSFVPPQNVPVPTFSNQQLFAELLVSTEGLIDGGAGQSFELSLAGFDTPNLPDTQLLVGATGVATVGNGLVINNATLSVVSAVPEPGSMVALASVAAGMIGYRRRTQRQSA